MDIKIKLDITKIQNDELYIGRKGVYLNAILLPNQKGKGGYDDGFILQNISKEGQTSGKRSRILGFWRRATPDTSKKSELPIGEKVILTLKGDTSEFKGILELEDERPDSPDVLSAKLRIGDVVFNERDIDSVCTSEQ
jgi:hypothetical protein